MTRNKDIDGSQALQNIAPTSGREFCLYSGIGRV